MRDTLISALKNVTGEAEVFVESPEIEEHGDYATNIALIKAKKEGKDPKEYAKNLAKKLKEDGSLTKVVSRIEVAGPGFINFFISDEALFQEITKAIDKGVKYGSSEIGKRKRVLVEYSSPNIAKYFGIGHLRSTIIGQALYNLYKFLGYKVISENHLGDWGTQFGMIIAQVVRNQVDPRQLSVSDFENLYVEFNKKAQDKPNLREEARDWFKKLEEGDKKAREIWEAARETSLSEFERVYKVLGVKFDNIHGESFYEDKMQAVIDEVREKGLAKKSRGAEIVEFKGITPAILVKTDGATTYFTRDLAALKYRIETWEPKIFIYEVGVDQVLHFRQVFEAAKLLGWKEKREFVHVAHGLIRFEGGKMATRRGESVRLEEVLNEAIKRARKIVEGSETGKHLSEKEKDAISRAVGIGAIKYFDLSHHYSTDIIFDWEKMFLLEGNSAPYLQYTYARTKSVLAKANGKNVEVKPGDLNKEEKKVARSLPRFSEVTFDAANYYSPNLLANYLFDLAQKYNNFYNNHRILGSNNEQFRLSLTKASGQVIKNGLSLLGIETLERM